MYRPQSSAVRKRICPTCKGSGKVFKNDVWNWGWKVCSSCNGKGQIEFAGPTELPPLQRNAFKSRHA